MNSTNQYKIRTTFFSNRTNLLVLLLNVLFAIYSVILAFYSRPHYDDLHFLWRLKEMSIPDFVNYFYFARSGRFVAYFLIGLIYKLVLFFDNYWIWPILFLIVGISLFWLAAKSIVRIRSKFLFFNAIVLFYNIFVLTNIDFAVFNWLCALSYYILAPMALLLMVLLNKQHLSIVEWICLFLISFFLGGGQEAFTPIVLFFMFLNGSYYLKFHNYSISAAWKDIRIKRIVYTALIMLVCLVIVVIAPGNYQRLNSSEFTTPTSLTAFLKGIVSAICKFYYYIGFYFPYYAILGALFFSIGFSTRNTNFQVKFNYRKFVLASFLLYALYILLSVLPSVYLWGGFGIQRNYTPTVFFTILFICLHAFLFGYFKFDKAKEKISKTFTYFGIVTLSIVMVVNIVVDTPSARSYAQSVDNRLERLQELNKQGVTGEVIVDPICVPYTYDVKYCLFYVFGKKHNIRPVLYYISDTDIVPNEYAYHLRKLYGLNFTIKLKKEVEVIINEK